MSEERSAEQSALTVRSLERTRQVVLAAAERALVESGYQALSTAHIQRAAGVSRGRLLHAFPSRAELVLFVGHELSEKLANALARSCSHGPELAPVVAALWSEAVTSPAVVAAIELWTGVRHDPGLASEASGLLAAFSIEGLVENAVHADLAFTRIDLETSMHLIRSVRLGRLHQADPELPSALQHWIDVWTRAANTT